VRVHPAGSGRYTANRINHPLNDKYLVIFRKNEKLLRYYYRTGYYGNGFDRKKYQKFAGDPEESCRNPETTQTIRNWLKNYHSAPASTSIWKIIS
jgi:hypothetical protein